MLAVDFQDFERAHVYIIQELWCLGQFLDCRFELTRVFFGVSTSQLSCEFQWAEGFSLSSLGKEVGL